MAMPGTLDNNPFSLFSFSFFSATIPNELFVVLVIEYSKELDLCCSSPRAYDTGLQTAICEEH